MRCFCDVTGRAGAALSRRWVARNTVALQINDLSIGLDFIEEKCQLSHGCRAAIFENSREDPMSVRRRTWENDDGSRGEAWIVSYTDGGGKRRLKTFKRRRDAESFENVVGVSVRAGLHVPDSQSITLAEAGSLWLDSCDLARLERATLVDYRRHLELHIVPLLGAVKLSQLTAPMVRGFADALRKGGM